MNIKEFKDLVDVHGDDLSDLPHAVCVQAMSLMERSEEARKLFERAKRLRALFEAVPRISAPAGLADRIVARATASDTVDPDVAGAMRQSLPWYQRMERPLRSTLLLSCLVCGLVVGLLAAPSPEFYPVLNTTTIFADLVQ